MKLTLGENIWLWFLPVTGENMRNGHDFKKAETNHEDNPRELQIEINDQNVNQNASS